MQPVASSGNSPSSPAFKVGDEVTFISVSFGADSDLVGKTGIVKAIYDDGEVTVTAEKGEWIVRIKDLIALAPATYTPRAGDVVEFEYTCSRGTFDAVGLVSLDGSMVKVWHNGEQRICQGSLNDSSKKNFRKIGSSEITASTSFAEAEAIAKAYFAKADKPQFTDDPDKSYADNQAAWIKRHGLKEGDKVRVVREFKSYEGDCGAQRWDESSVKSDMQGGTFVIESFEYSKVWLYSADDIECFPYFALEPAK